MSLKSNHEQIIEEIKAILAGVKFSHHEIFLNLSISALEGTINRQAVVDVAHSTNNDMVFCESLVQSYANLFWEAIKGCSSSTPMNISDKIRAAQLDEDFLPLFVQCFQRNYQKLAILKASVAAGKCLPHYSDFAWRLDIELGRRHVAHLIRPVFQIRLDISQRVDNDSSEVNITSTHLQSDFSNMKRLLTELEKAVDEMEGVHCQRLMHYI
eukprot:gene5203-10413_t